MHASFSKASGPLGLVETSHGTKDMLVLQMVQVFRQAARNAIDAGFDGVEVHGANVCPCSADSAINVSLVILTTALLWAG